MSNNADRACSAALFCLAISCLAVSGVCTAAPEIKLLYHESVELATSAADGRQQRMSFDAYGRRFDLLLEPNEGIRRAVPAGRTDIQPFSGTIEGQSGSWVRLTRTRGGWRGVISDGHELYAIEPTADVAGAAVQPLSRTGTAPVMYRLADALMPLGPGYCQTVTADGTSTGGTPTDGRVTALMAYKAVTAELAAQSAQTPERKLVVGVVADNEFTSHFSDDPEGAVIARMDVVDGIFATQAGVKILLAPLAVLRNLPAPFTKTAAKDLLAELRTYRRNTPSQLALGVTHLMTGRSLDGNIVGIAYLGSVCDGDVAASLSEGTRSTTMSALIAAHELGHNFNAPHDGEAGACASTPQTFLMAPQINFSNQFSSCSLQQIEARSGTAQCLTPYSPPHVALELPANSIGANVNSPFTLSFTAHAVGDDPSKNVIASATLPTSITLQSASSTGAGSCTSGAGTVSCTIGTLAAGESRQIDLKLAGSGTGASTVSLSLASSNDSIADNNTGQVTINIANPETTTAPATQPSSGAGAGGGGRLDITLLALLVGTLVARYANTMSRSFASTC